MYCANCQGKFIVQKGDLRISDKILGDFIVSNTEWEQCDTCGEVLYSPVTMRDIEKTEEQRKTELLIEKPLKEFLLGSEVAKILGCSRQALHKHKRIKRGFIHFVRHNNSIYYLKESVKKYKETGDGRIQLSKPKDNKKSNVINFAKACEGKGKERRTGHISAGSDSPCFLEDRGSETNPPDEFMEG